jgi:hypothetical protein
VFDDGRLVSLAGLVPVMGLAERAGLSQLVDERVQFRSSKVASAGVNPGRQGVRHRRRDGRRCGLHRRS